ncbi:xylulokinase [Halanaerocella petrolearia]
MDYLLGLDIGTSGTKGILVSKEGEVAAEATESYPLDTPQAGWAEQDPNDWWAATKEVIKELTANNEVASNDIKGISFSGQMHSSVFLNDEMEVIRPAILWSDTRTTKQCKEIEEEAGGLEELIGHVSNPALEGFTAPKILWLKENEPQNYEQVNYVLMPKDYVRYKLTQEIYTEVSDAAGTLLLNVEEKDWNLDLVEKLDLDSDILPPVINSIDLAGTVQDEVATEIGIKAGTPVVAGGADNACGAVGSGIVKEGRVMVSIGSSGTVAAQINDPVADEQGRVHLFNHTCPDSWYLMGVMLSAGMSYKWLKEDLYDNKFDYDILNKLASQVEPGSEGLIFLPYLYGERTPHADANARGVYFGISGKHEQGHFVRSLLEGVSFGLRDSLELIKDKDIEIDEVRVIGGGAKSELWQQILADILGEEISLINIEEGPAFGAALIAGVGVGVYDNFSAATENIIEVNKKVAPNSEKSEYYNNYYKLYKQLYASLKDDFKQLSQLQE